MAKQKLVLKESQLREMVKQAIMENLNEAEMDEINGWGRSLKDAWKGFKQGWNQSRYDYYGNKVNPNQNNNSDYNAPANPNAQPDNQSTTGDNYDNGEADNTQPQASASERNVQGNAPAANNDNTTAQEPQETAPQQQQTTQQPQAPQQNNGTIEIKITPEVKKWAQVAMQNIQRDFKSNGRYKTYGDIGRFVNAVAPQILNAK